MARLADEYLKRRGHDTDRVQYVVVRHHDKGHQHCHILLNRIRTDRTVVPQQFREYLRSKETCRALERDFALQPVRRRAPSLRRAGCRRGPRIGWRATGVSFLRRSSSRPSSVRPRRTAHDERVRAAAPGGRRPGPREHRPDRSRERDQLPARPRRREGERLGRAYTLRRACRGSWESATTGRGTCRLSSGPRGRREAGALRGAGSRCGCPRRLGCCRRLGRSARAAGTR